MKFLLGLVAGVVLATAGSLSAQSDYMDGYLKGYGGGVQAPQTGSWLTPGGKTGTYSHNPALGQTWIQDSEGNAGYLNTMPTPNVLGRRNPC